MAESPDVAEMVRRAMQANARFYKGWVDLSLEYFRGIAEIFSGEASQGGTDQVEPDAGVLVLEADAGAAARGAFLVTNDLGRNLSCELVASAFTDRSGSRVPAQVRFEPPRLDLAPGEQKAVQVVIPVGSELSAGVAYSGEFSIKGLEGFTVPVVLRRTHGIDERPDGNGSAGTPRPEQDMGKGTASAAAGAQRPEPGGKQQRAGRRSAKQKE